MTKNRNAVVRGIVSELLACALFFQSSQVVAQCVSGHTVLAADVVAALANDSIVIEPDDLHRLAYVHGTDTFTVWFGPSSFRLGKGRMVDSPFNVYSTGHCIFTYHWSGPLSRGLTNSEAWNAAVDSLQSFSLDSRSAAAFGVLCAASLEHHPLNIQSPLLPYLAPEVGLDEDTAVTRVRREQAGWRVSVRTWEQIECIFTSAGRILSYKRRMPG